MLGTKRGLQGVEPLMGAIGPGQGLALGLRFKNGLGSGSKTLGRGDRKGKRDGQGFELVVELGEGVGKPMKVTSNWPPPYITHPVRIMISVAMIRGLGSSLDRGGKGGWARGKRPFHHYARQTRGSQGYARTETWRRTGLV